MPFIASNIGRPGAAVLLAAVLILAAPIAQPPRAQTPSPDREAVAQFSGGVISRREFRDVMLIRFRGSIPANKTLQRAFLRRYALLRIAAAGNNPRDLEKNRDYIKRSALLRERVRIEAYRRYLLKLPPRNVYRMMRLQIMLLKTKKTAKRNRTGESPELARKGRAIAAELNRPGLSVNQVEDILARYTASARYKVTGGLLSPQCLNCAWSQTRTITRALEKAGPMRFTYVYSDYGHMVARRLSIQSVPSAKLEEYFLAHYREQGRAIERNIKRFKDEKTRRKMRRSFPGNASEMQGLARRFRDYFVNRETRGRFRRRIELFKNARELRLYPAARSRSDSKRKYGPDTPLYIMSGRVFTYGRLTELLPAPHFDQRSRLRRLQIIITHRLLSGGRAYEKVGKGSEFQALLSYAWTAVRGRAYYDARMPEVPDVGKKAIRAEYDRNRSGRYRGRDFIRVRRRIMIELQEKAYRAARKKFDDALARKFKLKLFADRI